MGDAKKNESLRIRMQTVNMAERSITESTCTLNDKKAAIRIFKDFLKNHGTGIDDFDEFHCTFVITPPTRENRT